MTEGYNERNDHDSWQAARFLGRAVTTLLVTPPHLRIYRDIKNEDVETGVVIPLQPDIENITRSIEREVLPNVTHRGDVMSGPNRAMTAGLLMQFGNHFREIPDSLKTPYSTLSDLLDTMTTRADQYGRLSLAEQLSVALEQADGSLDRSLRNLFITSRMYARWLDEKTITGLPQTSLSERKRSMRAWQDALLGFKPGGETYHDTAGDTYYAWTHAYSGYMFESLLRKRMTRDKLAQAAFRNGTVIMQTCVNNFNPRGTISDHTIAARYGNAIADVCNRKTE